MVANVAANPILARQRGTSFDVPVRFDTQRREPGAARAAIAASAVATQHVLVRAEVANVVAAKHRDPRLVATTLQLRQYRENLEQVIRLQDRLRFVGGTTH